MLALSCSLLLAACAVDDTDPALAAQEQELTSTLAFSPAGYDFGAVSLSESRVAALTLQNLTNVTSPPLNMSRPTSEIGRTIVFFPTIAS